MDKKDFLVSLAQQANEIMLKYHNPGGVVADIKEDMSPVTKADLEINSLVIKETKKYFPDYGILGEEEAWDETNKNLIVVDPLDGTKMFAIGAPLFAFSAAFVHDGVPVAGILHNPLAKRTIYAEQGKGALLIETDTVVSVSEVTKVADAMIETGWSQSHVASRIHEQGGRTPAVYAICEGSAILATGGFDGIVFTGCKPWDMAAAKIIVEEAGGKVTDLLGNEQRYDKNIRGALLSNGHLHESLLEIVSESNLVEKINI